ncbi:MAG: fused MFS/spermidine synthase [Pseudomonadota bacterium]
MTETTAAHPVSGARTPPLFVIAVFTSAALVFMVQPMVAKLVLPQLGGSPAVWNTSMAFFQAALLVGYGYAHFLQKLGTVRRQIVVHIIALALAGLTLPLRISGLLGEPSSTAPTLWLLGVLALSIGLPFAILSATAPLVQAWYARTVRGEGATEPYALYAASNLGSLLALLSYPILMEPLLTLQGQRFTWSGGYLAFVLILASLALLVWRSAAAGSAADAPATADATPAGPAPGWKQWLVWIALAAVPSSLILGVTTHLVTDVASAPFLWVAPLALYLVTFIIAFQTRPLISPYWALLLQGAALPACIFMAPLHGSEMPLILFVNLSCFFLSALVCHQALVARRPDPAHLTEFYLCLSIGGVVGGAFNAFLAPVIFDNVLEYPLVLVLAGLARPWRWGKLTIWENGVLITGAAGALAAFLLTGHLGNFLTLDSLFTLKTLLCLTVVAAFMLRERGVAFTLLLALLAMGATKLGDRTEVIQTDRSFFGVLRQTRVNEPRIGGELRLLSHGTTLHGAQATDPRYRCRPLVYYAPETPIGQVFTASQVKPALRVGAVGLGTGSVAAYSRPGDHTTFFEIDPLVIRIAHETGDFTYTTECAKGAIDFVLGDARLTLAKQPDASFDILLIDAFSSDAIPAHLLTVEALKGYLAKLKPDGVLILHLSNRNLELRTPAMAVAKAAGGYALLQRHPRADTSPQYWESGEDVLIVAHSAEALAEYQADNRWTPADSRGTKPWTDDYTNLVGALYGRFKERWEAE